MMKNLTLRNITEVCSGIYHGPEKFLDQEVSAITTDSRKAEKGGLFVPIVGERVDAHKFIPDVMEKGCLASLSGSADMQALRHLPLPRTHNPLFPSQYFVLHRFG